MLNMYAITKEIIYQYTLLRFATFGKIKFSNNLPIKKLLEMSLEVIVLLKISLENPLFEWTPKDGPKSVIAESIASTVFKENATMLAEYFAIEIDEKGNLVAIPNILEGLIPDLGKLPSFVMMLATEVPQIQ